MSLRAGDTIVVESEKATQPPRTGVIEEVLQEDPPRLRVQWSDGRTSILAPTPGAAKVAPARRRSKRSGP